jgi:hypothetical protein
MNQIHRLFAALLLASLGSIHAADPDRTHSPASGTAALQKGEANRVVEVELISKKTYQNPFKEVELDAIIQQPDGTQLRVPAYWAGGNRWCFRHASFTPGLHTWRTECSDKHNPKLHDLAGKFEILPYHGENALYQHGPIRVAKDQRHFAHADGTPFFWLGDTWWKCLSKRLTWDGFQELTVDRKAKGFTVVQIVCGPYPDEGMFEPRWENEGGKPYETKDFSVVNPVYFDYADRRLRLLVEAGLTPAIVGGWGREQAGCKSTIALVGTEGYLRHWRHLIARYGAYPAVWVLGGEASDKQGPWTEVARYLRAVDPYRHLFAYHAQGHPRQALRDNGVFDFDMIAIGHDSFGTAAQTLAMIQSCLAQTPVKPALCGEGCYEGHMQTNFQDVQRHLFWSCMLSGAAGHTYGAAGIWQASVDGDPGITPVYDFTTWKEGMNYPGSTQLGLGKKQLEQYPWSRFEPHPEWVEPGCYAAGIPGEVRFIYIPRRNIYTWSGPTVQKLEPDVDWHVYYFDPATGRKFDRGIIKAQVETGNKTAKPLAFKQDVPSPQDWVLVLERVKP